jgi:hypothetical protein
MPAGERSQTWFPEIVTALHTAWTPDLLWQSVIELRDRLQQKLEQLIRDRGIQPATVRCSECGYVGPGPATRISVRAMLLALSRFEIESKDTVRELEKSWARHRKLHRLDRFGRSESEAPDSSRDHSQHVQARAPVTEEPT